jgi:hypothetical protein
LKPAERGTNIHVLFQDNEIAADCGLVLFYYAVRITEYAGPNIKITGK